MTYAVVLSEDDGPEHAGRLELARDGLAFSGGGCVPYSALRDVYVERRVHGRPALILVSDVGERLRIESLEGLGALHELAEQVFEARGKAAT